MANPPHDHNEFALVAEAAPDNMNAWVEWDEDEEEEDLEMKEEEEDPEMEEKEEEMDVDANESEIEFEEVAPMPPPPIPADHEPEAEATTIGIGRMVPLTGRRLFTNTQVYIGSSSSVAAGYDLKDLTPSSIRSDLNALHSRVRQIEKDDVRIHLPPHLHYQEAPYVPPTALVVPVTHDDPRDPYVAARDVATVSATYDDGRVAREETSPSEPQGFPPRNS
ncbi:hypothetical protein Tco_1251946 [Tanacetum coccineum]